MKITKTRLQEIIREEFKRLNEGPAYEYAKPLKKIEKLENQYDKAILDFFKTAKKYGGKDTVKEMERQYRDKWESWKGRFNRLVQNLL